MADPATKDDTLQRHLDAIEERGYTLLAGVIEEDLVDALADDLLRIERDHGIVVDKGFKAPFPIEVLMSW